MQGTNLTLHASPGCNVTSLHLHVDWRGSLGRTGGWYWTAVPGWAVGVVVWILFSTLGEYKRGGTTAIIFYI
jgi:glycosylphosphatidylinositol deacylase